LEEEERLEFKEEIKKQNETFAVQEQNVLMQEKIKK
jgi:hypothetical protein